MFYDIYVRLCAEKGVSPTAAALDMGFSKATPTTWKKSGFTPRMDKILIMSDYFDVPPEVLLGKESDKGQQKKPLTEDEELEALLEEARERSDLRMLFKLAKGATPDDVRQAIKIIKALREGEE